MPPSETATGIDPEEIACVLEELPPGELSALVAAIIVARNYEADAGAALQAARAELGLRQRAWQDTQEVTRKAVAELKRFIDHQAGLSDHTTGEVW